MLLLILESLGSTELLFILVMALVFFGPRKLPQISRTLGKTLAEFRRASDDFKRTWEREVAMESTLADTPQRMETSTEGSGFLEDGPLSETEHESSLLQTQPSEYAVPRERTIMADPDTTSADELKSTEASEPLQKRDWL